MINLNQDFLARWVISDFFAYLNLDGRLTVLGSPPVLYLRGNRQIKLLAEADDPAQLGCAVQESFYKSRYPQLKRRLENGREVNFGHVVLCAAGIRREGDSEFVPWFRIAAVSWEFRTEDHTLLVVIRKHGSEHPWISVSALAQDNVGLLVQIASEYLGRFQDETPTSNDPHPQNLPPQPDDKPIGD
ncbi:MAG: hypothetical protein K2V38_20355 [Gemmataceae bacterium]|nr:hypothetical protein [Gemmataceae bacterium]